MKTNESDSKGMIQVESDAICWTRSDTGGQRTEALFYSNPPVKFGLTDNSDIQFNLSPQVEVRSRVAGQTLTQSGVGDLTVRFKQHLTGPANRVQDAVVPFVQSGDRRARDSQWRMGRRRGDIGAGLTRFRNADTGAAIRAARQQPRSQGSTRRILGPLQPRLSARPAHDHGGRTVDRAKLGTLRHGSAIPG